MASKDYKYQFLSPPPDDVICPLCLDIVEEPHQLTCCGQHICKICGDKLKQLDTNSRCPTCRHSEFVLLPDKYFERNTLNKLPIWCTEGCGQEMELGQLKNHLQQCPCVQEDCPYGCGQQYQRQYIEEHKVKCPKRPFICCYCKYQSTYEVIVNEHYSVCDKYPIICPNECSRDEIEQGILQDHLDKCPLQVVECEFSHVGCREKVQRCDLAQHLSDNGVHHTALSSKMIYEGLQKMLKDKDSQLQEKDRQLQEKDKKIDLLLSEVCELRAENKILLTKIYDKVCDVIIMTEFEYKKDNRVRWFSPPYFTHVNGYKMCFEVDFRSSIMRRSLYLYSYMMRGPYDDYLQWPFKGKVIIQLLNQCDDDHHYDYVFDYKDSNEGKRVTCGERGIRLQTQSTCLSYDEFVTYDPFFGQKIHCRSKFESDDDFVIEKQSYSKFDCQYLVNDCLKFRVIVPH